MLVTLRGTPCLYQGDESAWSTARSNATQVLDVVGTRLSGPITRVVKPPSGRPCRGHPAPEGVTAPGRGAWLPMTDPGGVQRGRPARATRIRCSSWSGGRSRPGGQRGARRRSLPVAGLARRAPGPSGGGEATTVLLNMADAPATFDGVRGTVAVGNPARARGVEHRGALALPPWSSVVAWSMTGAASAGERPALRAVHDASQGHTAPLLAVARRLSGEGREVVFFTTAHCRDAVEATGTSFVPLGRECDAHRPDGGQPRAEIVVKRGVRGVRGRSSAHLRRADPRGQRRDLRAILDGFPRRVHRGGHDVPRHTASRLGPRVDRPALACIGVMPYASNSRDTAPFGATPSPAAVACTGHAKGP